MLKSSGSNRTGCPAADGVERRTLAVETIGNSPSWKRDPSKDCS